MRRCRQVLEALALGEDIPEQDEYGIRPDKAAILCAAGPEIEALRVHKHCSFMLGSSEYAWACIACSCIRPYVPVLP